MNAAVIARILKRYRRFLITSHVNPEGDSLGSELALRNLIRSLGKRAVILNQDPVPPRYLFLPGAASIRVLKNNRLRASRFRPEAVFVLDCPTLERTGNVSGLLDSNAIIVNIDHHPKNDAFGTVNWVDTDVSSVGEMIYRIFRSLRTEPGKTASLCLYVSILTDTGSFAFANTSSRTHEVVSKLLKKNLSPEVIFQKIYYHKSFREMKLVGLALSGMGQTADGRIVWIKVTPKIFSETGADIHETEGIIQYIRMIDGVEVAMVFLEMNGTVKVSLRSNGKIDVSAIARSFGGGGHRKASGCSVPGAIDKVEKKVLREVKEALG